jgi:hypothetical protein
MSNLLAHTRFAVETEFRLHLHTLIALSFTLVLHLRIPCLTRNLKTKYCVAIRLNRIRGANTFN